MAEVRVSCYVCGEQVLEGDDCNIHMMLVHNQEYNKFKTTNLPTNDDYKHDGSRPKDFFLPFTKNSIFSNDKDLRSESAEKIMKKVEKKETRKIEENDKSLLVYIDYLITNIESSIMNIETSIDQMLLLHFSSHKAEIDRHSKIEKKHCSKRDIGNEETKSAHGEASNRFPLPVLEQTENNDRMHSKPETETNSQVKKEIKHEFESNLDDNKLQTVFFCPFKSCNFYTSKNGMREGKAAIHLKNDHKVNPREMNASDTPKKFQFTKLKFTSKFKFNDE